MGAHLKVKQTKELVLDLSKVRDCQPVMTRDSENMSLRVLRVYTLTGS